MEKGNMRNEKIGVAIVLIVLIVLSAIVISQQKPSISAETPTVMPEETTVPEETPMPEETTMPSAAVPVEGNLMVGFYGALPASLVVA